MSGRFVVEEGTCYAQEALDVWKHENRKNDPPPGLVLNLRAEDPAEATSTATWASMPDWMKNPT